MSKELTEQWKNGTLERNYYYLKFNNGEIEIQDNFIGGFIMAEGNRVAEVLAPVPSHDEYCGFVQKMHILEKLQDFCELLLVGEKQEWERIVKRGNRKEMAKWLNERKNKTVERLEKKLKIAKKVLNDILNDGDDYWDQDKAQEALTKMEGVK